MSDQHILCVGMCVLDIIHLCAQYPQEDTDKRCLDGYWQKGGNASNNCTVLSKLGAKCEFLGTISSAPAFQFLYEDYKAKNIDISNCPTTEMNPPFSSVILVKDTGSRTIVHANPGFPILKYEDFCKIDLNKYSWIHFEGRNIEETKQMMEMIQNHNETKQKKTIKISIELEKHNRDLFKLAENVDVVFIGKDMAQYMGWSSAKETVLNARQIIMDLKAQNLGNILTTPSIICPWGSECSDAWNGIEGKYCSQKALFVENIVDSLGAGDTFVAAVIYAINNLRKGLEEAIDFGNRVAAYKIQYRGYDCVADFQM